MGLFTIAKVPDYTVKQGDNETMTFIVKGFNLQQNTISFKGVCPTGSIYKISSGATVDDEGITVTAFSANQQSIIINFLQPEFKSMQGVMKYEVQYQSNQKIYTLIEGRIIISPEIVKGVEA